MIGIILASHGDFAKGIKESSEMIFGSQENLETVMLKPSMGPEEYRNNLKKPWIRSEVVIFYFWQTSGEEHLLTNA